MLKTMFTSPQQRTRWFIALPFIFSLFAILLAFGLITIEVYVRWTLNQDFTFLGGHVIEVLLIVGFGTLWGLIFTQSKN